MTVSPFATKARVHRLEARVAELEALVDRLLEELRPAVVQLNRNTETLVHLGRHLRARDAAAGSPAVWH